jgi:hypothetical protein
MKKNDKYKILRDLHRTQGELAYYLEVFGDELANRNGYKDHDGMDAIYFYLVEKYHWPPSQVRSMSHDDLRFLLEEEMHGWSAPKAAR